jgi:hypothetical protein
MAIEPDDAATPAFLPGKLARWKGATAQLPSKSNPYYANLQTAIATL